MTSTRIGLNLAALGIVACALASCASPGAPAPAVAPPPASGVPDYQLGDAYPPDDRVRIVGRDRSAEPADGLYSICYVNGFQTQPDERDEWPDELLLRTAAGEPIIDPDWPDEVILDTSTTAKRRSIADIVGPWIEACAASGFQAVEFDNLDTFTRTDGALALDDNLSLAATLVDVAHGAGLAAGQKNAAEYAADLHDAAGFDFAVTEECAAYDECASYTDVYGSAVIDIEYSDALPRTFDEMCADPGSPSSMVLRDRRLSAPGDPDHVFAVC